MSEHQVRAPKINDVRTLLCYYRMLKLPWAGLAGAVLLAVLASLSECASLALLIPTIKGILNHDVQFVRETPVLSVFFPRLPTAITESYRVTAALLVLLTFASAMIKIVFGFGSALWLTKTVRLFSHRLRVRLFERYLSFGKLYFDSRSQGYLQQILSTYVYTIAHAITVCNDVCYALSTLVVYLVMMFAISFKLTLVVLLSFPVIYCIFTFFIERLRASSSQYTIAYNILGRDIANTLSCIPLIKAYHCEPLQGARFDETSGRVAQWEFSMDKKRLAVGPCIEIVILFFLFVLVVAMGMSGGADRDAEAASYFVFLLILKRAGTLYTTLTGLRAALATIHGPLQEVESVLDDADKHYITGGSEHFSGVKREIEFSGVSFAYPNAGAALSDVTFSLKAGSITAIVGASGAGKSTLINLLMRFYDPRAGAIYVDGTDLRELSLLEWRSHIALVSQESLLLNASLRDNLLFGLPAGTIGEEELQAALDGARLADLVRSLPRGLETDIGDRGVTLSGGERQRVSMARAILRAPEILLLDEATSALDSTTERLIQSAIDELVVGKTTLVVAHRLSTVRKADTVIVIEGGRVIEQGSIGDLMGNKGPFFRYWTDQHRGFAEI